MTGPQDTTELRGVRIPRLGLGVFRAGAGGQTKAAVQAAPRAGSRHIDTARIYGTEADAGAGLCDSGPDREQVFITCRARERCAAG